MTPWNNQSGLTLIETLVALMLFSVGMLAMSGLSTILVRGNTLSQKITTATILAQDKLEEVHNALYDSLQDETETIIAINKVPYTRTVDVMNDVPTAGMKTVAIAVSWAKSDTPDHQVVLKTIVAGAR